jgi:hypothetical protein
LKSIVFSSRQVTRASSPRPSSAKTVRSRTNLQVGYQQEIDDVDHVIRLANQNGPPAWDRRDEFSMVNRHIPTIRKMNHKGPEWLGFVSAP